MRRSSYRQWNPDFLNSHSSRTSRYLKTKDVHLGFIINSIEHFSPPISQLLILEPIFVSAYRFEISGFHCALIKYNLKLGYIPFRIFKETLFIHFVSLLWMLRAVEGLQNETKSELEVEQTMDRPRQTYL